MERGDAETLRRWIDGLAAIGTAVNRPVPLPELLDLVARTAARLLGLDFCAVLLPDAEDRVLLVEGSHGLSAAYVAQVNATRPLALAPGGSPSGRAFLTRATVRVPDIAADPDFGPWGQIAREQGYRSMVAIPLVVDDRVLGTLNGYRREAAEPAAHTDEPLDLLADQVATAIHSARLREREQAAHRALRASHASLAEQTDLLRRAGDVHEQLTAVALRAGGVQGVARALADLLERAVMVTEEPSGRVLVPPRPGSPGAADLAGPPALPASPVASVPVASSPVVRGVAGTGAPVVSAVVLMGGEAVARIWAPGEPEDLSPLDVQALEHAATVCALELLRDRTALEVEWRQSGEVLTDLLVPGARSASTVVQRAARLGHDLAQPHVLLVAGTGQSPVPDRLVPAARALGSGPRPLVAPVEDHVVVLLRVAAADELLRLLLRADPGRTVLVTTSQTCRRVEDYPAAFRRARGAVAVARSQGRAGGIVATDELGLPGLLLQLDDAAELVRFAATRLQPLRAHDAARGTSLEATLRSHLAHDLRTADTAAALFVHPNTVGLRLRRAEQLLGVSLTSVAALAELQVALGVDAQDSRLPSSADGTAVPGQQCHGRAGDAD